MLQLDYRGEKREEEGRGHALRGVHKDGDGDGAMPSADGAAKVVERGQGSGPQAEKDPAVFRGHEKE